MKRECLHMNACARLKGIAYYCGVRGFDGICEECDSFIDGERLSDVFTFMDMVQYADDYKAWVDLGMPERDTPIPIGRRLREMLERGQV